MSQIEDDLNVAEYLERTGACTPADYIIIRLANEVRRLRQEVDDRRNYMNKIWHHIGDFPLWDGDEIVYMKGSGVIT